MATIIGTPNSETLTGTDFTDSIFGLGGKDILNGLAGNDTLDGGADNDVLKGGEHNDVLVGGLGRDWLYGELGNDQLFGGGRRDRLYGGDHHDTLDGGTGNDIMVGGTGDDVYIVDSAQDTIIENLGEGGDEVRTSLLSFTLASNFEILTFTGSGNFVGVGNAENNAIFGGSGNDALSGAAGFDALFGGSGNDVLDGGADDDRLFGGSGRDTIIGADGNDQLEGAGGRDKLFAGAGNDTLLGQAYNDTLQGGTGNDLVDGGAGTDTALFSGLKGDYAIRRISDQIEVVDLNKVDGDDGTDLLSGVEILRFKDGVLPPPTIIAAVNLETLDGTDGFAVSGIPEDLFGRSVSEAGDVNGDGFDDVIIGAPNHSASPYGYDPFGYGLSYVMFGKANWTGHPQIFFNGTDGFTLSSKENYGRLGYSVSSAGDVNGDGFADLIVGAPGEYRPYDGGNQTGQAYVVFGKASWAGTPDFDLATLNGSNGFRLTHPGAYEYAGFSVSSTGDINGDGLDDLIVGVPNESNTGGASYVVFGKADWTGTPALDVAALDGTNGFRLGGVALNDRAGASVSSAGDVNGDGLDDLIVGAPNAGKVDQDTGRPPGEAYVVFGKANWTGTPSLELETLDGTDGFRITSESGSQLGRSVHAAGDVNGDGIADVIVGTPYVGNVRAAEGYVVFGKADWTGAPVVDVATLDGTNGFRLVGADLAGYEFAVSSAGDVNGDGLDDLIVGGLFAGDMYGQSAGQAFVVYGKENWAGTLDLADLDGTNGFQLIRGASYDNIGFSVSSAGDVNNDGFDDLLVGATTGGESTTYVVFGGNFNNAAVQVAADDLSMPIGSG
jgi:Ca2+-binding RTX toxin-like protein